MTAILKKCKECGEEKSSKAFRRRDAKCRSCLNAIRRARYGTDEVYKQRHVVSSRKWRAQDPERAKQSTLASYQRNRDKYLLQQRLRNHGLTVDEYVTMFAAQGGLCAICRQPERAANRKPTTLCIDHDHETGRVRGLLCSGCNSSIGYAQDDPARLRAAADYLERNKQATEGSSS